MRCRFVWASSQWRRSGLWVRVESFASMLNQELSWIDSLTCWSTFFWSFTVGSFNDQERQGQCLQCGRSVRIYRNCYCWIYPRPIRGSLPKSFAAWLKFLGREDAVLWSFETLQMCVFPVKIRVFFVGCLFDGVTCSEASSCHKRQSWKNCSWIFNTSILWLGESYGATFFAERFCLPAGGGCCGAWSASWSGFVGFRSTWSSNRQSSGILELIWKKLELRMRVGAVVSPRFNPVEVKNL